MREKRKALEAKQLTDIKEDWKNGETWLEQEEMRERVIILYPILKERNREERMKGGSSREKVLRIDRNVGSKEKDKRMERGGKHRQTIS